MQITVQTYGFSPQTLLQELEAGGHQGLLERVGNALRDRLDVLARNAQVKVDRLHQDIQKSSHADKDLGLDLGS